MARYAATAQIAHGAPKGKSAHFLGRAKGTELNNPSILDNPENDSYFQEKIGHHNNGQRLDRERESNISKQRFVVWSVQPGIDVSKASFNGTEIDLCVICARSIVLSGESMTSIACTFCELWDCLLGHALGETEFFGLNRSALGLDFDTSTELLPWVQNARIEGIGAVINTWLNLYYWQSREISLLIQDAGWEHQRFIILSDWIDEYPESALASLEAYIRLIEEQHPWAIYICPEAINMRWYFDQLPQSKELVE